MFGFFKNLLRKPADDAAEVQGSAPAESSPPHPSGQTAARGRPSAHGAAGQHSKGIELPVQSIIAALPVELQPKVRLQDTGSLTITVPLEKVLAQLSRGAVRISFGELRQAVPEVFTTENDKDRVLVTLPLGDILARLSPALISRRRVQRQVQVPAEIASPFDGDGHGLIFSVAAANEARTAQPGPKAPSPAPSAKTPGRAASVAAPPPMAPPAVVPAPAARLSLKVAPTPAPPTLEPPPHTAPAAPIAFQAPPPPAPKPAVTPAPRPQPIPMSKPVERKPVAPAPAATAKAAPLTPQKIVQKLQTAAPAHPAPSAGAPAPAPQRPVAAPQARVAPPTPTPTPSPDPVLPPLMVPVPPVASPTPQLTAPVAPAPVPVMPAAAAPARPVPVPEPLVVSVAALADAWPEPIRKEVVELQLVDSKLALPTLTIEQALKTGRLVFSWNTVRSWVRPGVPGESPHGPTTVELPLKVIAPLFLMRQREAGKPQQKVAVDEDIPNLFFGFPQAETPIPVAQATARPSDTNFYVWDDASDSVKVPETETKRGPGPGTKFVAKYATPNEVVSRASGLDGVLGALIALPDGLMVANRLPPEVNADTLAAFLPQIFGKVSQCTKELRMGELNNLNFTVGNVPWKIFRVNAIYFAAFGKSGEPLPTAQLAALAAELDHNPR